MPWVADGQRTHMVDLWYVRATLWSQFESYIDELIISMLKTTSGSRWGM